MTSSIKVYPIPTENILNIEIANFNDRINAEIYNSRGQALRTLEIQNSFETVSLSDLKAGYYTIRFFNGTIDRSIMIIKTE